MTEVVSTQLSFIYSLKIATNSSITSKNLLKNNSFNLAC